MRINLQTIAHRIFQIGIVLKGLDGLLEVMSGTAFMLSNRATIQRAVAFMTREELIEDPHDLIANFFVHAAQRLSIGAQHVAGLYLLAHGAIKLILVIGLLRRVPWSYPIALLFLAFMVFYQTYQSIQSHSIILSFLMAFDFAIAGLVWREWQRSKARDNCAA